MLFFTVIFAVHIFTATAERQTTRTAITGLIETATVTATTAALASSTSVEIFLPTELPNKDGKPPMQLENAYRENPG